MNGAAKRILDHAASVLPPALVLLLLGIQVALGLRGFDRPDDSLLYVLQVPGVLLGWGGVALLVPLLAWMIMDWWGYDLTGFALKGLGSAVLGISMGTLVGIGAGPAGGGIVGAGLADVLVSTLGSTFGVILMLLMAGPAGVLALSLQRSPAPRGRAEARPRSADHGAAPAREPPARRFSLPRLLPRRRKVAAPPSAEATNAWYPPRRYDDEGNELPVEFGPQRGIGGIRFADADDEAAPAEESAPVPDGVAQDEERLPTIPELLSGQFDRSRLALAEDDDPADAQEGIAQEANAQEASGEAAPAEAWTDEPDDAGPIHVDSEGRPIVQRRPAPVVAPAPPPPPVAEPATPALEIEGVEVEVGPTEVPPTRAAPLTFVALDADSRPAEPTLAPGVRYADEPLAGEAGAEGAPSEGAAVNGRAAGGERDEPAPEKEAKPAASAALSASVQDAVRGPAHAPREQPSAAARIDALRDTLRTSFASMQDGDSGERYLAKLEAIGMFDAVDPPRPTPAAKARPKRRASARKKAAAGSGTSKAGTSKADPSKAGTSKAGPSKAGPSKAGASKAGASKAGERKPAAPPGARKKAPAKKKAARRPGRAGGVAQAAATRKAGPGARRKPQPGVAADPAVARRRALLASLRQARSDPLFVRAVEAALERGAASPVLYTRRLGLPYDRACAMVERLLGAGIVGEATATGAHPVRLSRTDWEASA